MGQLDNFNIIVLVLAVITFDNPTTTCSRLYLVLISWTSILAVQNPICIRILITREGAA
jgi:hypothetical protein